MPHTEILQNGVVIVKPDARLRRALTTAMQFFGALAKRAPELRTMVRHEQILRWLHREIRDYAKRRAYRGKEIYVALNDKILVGTDDLSRLIREQSRSFLKIGELESKLRQAFDLVARTKIEERQKRRLKKNVQTYGEPWQHRSEYGKQR